MNFISWVLDEAPIHISLPLIIFSGTMALILIVLWLASVFELLNEGWGKTGLVLFFSPSVSYFLYAYYIYVNRG